MRRYTERVDFTLPLDTKKRLRTEAELQGISLSELVRRMVDDFMAREPTSS